jgi:hypothetical protein
MAGWRRGRFWIFWSGIVSSGAFEEEMGRGTL